MFDFDRIIDRRNTHSIKWAKVNDNSKFIPMWVADMDFETAPCVKEALLKRVSHGVFGYTDVGDDFYEAIISWFSRRHGLELKKEYIIYTTSVVPALSATIKALCKAGDRVLLQAPVYHCFYSSIKNNGCEVVSNDLIYKDKTYSIDFEDLEAKFASGIKVMILCNPHNPAGRVWTQDELLAVGHLAKKYGVTVISDEIHCEFVFPGHKYIPFASLEDFEDFTVTLNSPSKAFNIASLQIATIFCKDEAVRKSIDRAININEICDVGVLGVEALIAAYTQGDSYIDELNAYIYDNYLAFKDYFEKNLPDFEVVKLEGTYLTFVDCRALHMSSKDLCEEIEREALLQLNSGSMYGNADTFLRFNIAMPRVKMLEALDRFKTFVKGKIS